MAVSELGWSTLLEADSYFDNERLVITKWDALDDDDKNKTLNMAYNRIYYNPDYNTPAAGAETATQKVKLIKIQAEMAYYLAVHLTDEDGRMGLRSQGVVKAGIAKEDYKEDMELPMPPIVAAMLEEEGFTTDRAFGMADINRDEDESVDEDVTD